MSSSSTLPDPRRRSLLQLAFSTGLGLGLAACGGGSDDEGQDNPAILLQTQADDAVASGLVGLSLGEVTPSASTVVVAGKRRLGRDARVLEDDRFAIGSNTKAMTSAAIVALAARGGPALSLTLAEAFIDWAGELHPAYAAVTLADLLHHRGALPAFDGNSAEEEAFLAVLASDTRALPDTMMGRRAYFTRWLLARPPVQGVTPGSGFHYSNAGYVVAAALVESRTNRAFEAVFDEVLVQPLGLRGAWRSSVPGECDELWGHEGPRGGLAVVEADAESLATKEWQDLLGPAGHWACSGTEYAQWLRWHMEALRGANTPLPATYVNDLRAASGERYVWGWQSVTTPRRVLLAHTGHVAGFMAEVALDRAGEFAVFGLSNTGHFADDGSSWVLGRIDAALTEVLRQRSVALRFPGRRLAR